MRKILFLTTLSLFAVTACVPHDPDEVEVNQPDAYWRTTETQPVIQPAARPVVVQQPQVQYVRPVVVQQPAPQPVVVQQAPQPSWWQQNKQKHKVKVAVPTCPCQDPNDPCTHCYQK